LPCRLQKNAVAVAYVKRGKGEIRLNGGFLDKKQEVAWS
jgi:ribosomal protein S9